MDQLELERKLMAAARAHPPSERVPYAFEKRVMAHLRICPPADEWGLWGRALWRAATPCLGIMLLFSAWSWLAPDFPASDLAQDIDNVVLAGVDQDAAPDALQ